MIPRRSPFSLPIRFCPPSPRVMERYPARTRRSFPSQASMAVFSSSGCAPTYSAVPATASLSIASCSSAAFQVRCGWAARTEVKRERIAGMSSRRTVIEPTTINEPLRKESENFEKRSVRAQLEGLARRLEPGCRRVCRGFRQAFSDRRRQRGVVQGLAEGSEGSLESRGRGLHDRGHYDDSGAQVRLAIINVLQHPEPVETRHQEIEQDCSELGGPEPLDCAESVANGFHRQTFLDQAIGDERRSDLVVFNNQDSAWRNVGH